jgi:hypothetical protein
MSDVPTTCNGTSRLTRARTLLLMFSSRRICDAVLVTREGCLRLCDASLAREDGLLSRPKAFGRLTENGEDSLDFGWPDEMAMLRLAFLVLSASDWRCCGNSLGSTSSGTCERRLGVVRPDMEPKCLIPSTARSNETGDDGACGEAGAKSAIDPATEVSSTSLIMVSTFPRNAFIRKHTHDVLYSDKLIR